MSKKSYFHIELEHLKNENLFPFHIYVFNPQSKTYSAFLYGNSPLDEEKKEFLEFIVSKGGKIAIERKQKKTFLKNMDYEEEDIPSLQEPEEHPYERNANMYKALIKQRDERDGFFHYDLKIAHAIEEDNFTEIISRVHDEVMCFSVKVSDTVSLAMALCEKLMTEDTPTNRIVALAYMLAKINKLNDEKTLSDIIVASFLHHIGLTQLELSLGNKPIHSQDDKTKKDYRKHPGLSQHLVRKSGLNLSNSALQAISQHHERFDGSGYPSELKGEHIESAALFVGSISHIFDFASGRVVDQKYPIKNIIKKFKNKDFTPGLEFEFGDKILESIENIMNTDNNSNAA
ncbi:MAG: hypothetical protein H6622_09640 [Halobacteriovoraceae bacterium]|nr:hypothetical protein [Halobacteriovoraceae bacterium]